MHAIDRIQFQDGPEDGRILSMDVIRSLVVDPIQQPDEICLYLEPDATEARHVPVLLGRYQLREVRGNLASYRWQVA